MRPFFISSARIHWKIISDPVLLGVLLLFAGGDFSVLSRGPGGELEALLSLPLLIEGIIAISLLAEGAGPLLERLSSDPILQRQHRHLGVGILVLCGLILKLEWAKLRGNDVIGSPLFLCGLAVVVLMSWAALYRRIALGVQKTQLAAVNPDDPQRGGGI